MRSSSQHITSTAGLPDPAPALSRFNRIPEAGIDSRKYIGLDRNERLTPFPDWFMENIRKSVTSTLLTWYPTQDQLHKQLSESIGVPEEGLILTPSSDAAFKSLYQAYVRPGDKVVMLDPSYAMFPVYADMFEGTAVLVPYENNLQLDPNALLDQIKPGVRLVMLANPNQPTGTLLDDNLIIDVINRASTIGALVAMDEAYYPFGGRTALPWLNAHSNLLVIRTFSKAYGLAGLRIGFVAGHPDVISNISKVHTVNDLNSMSVLCAKEILSHPEVIDEYILDVQQGSRTLAKAAQDLGLTPIPTHTNFMLIRVANRCTPSSLVEALKARGYLIKGSFESQCISDCVRITLGSSDVMSEFVDALRDAIEWCEISENN